MLDGQPYAIRARVAVVGPDGAERDIVDKYGEPLSIYPVLHYCISRGAVAGFAGGHCCFEGCPNAELRTMDGLSHVLVPLWSPDAARAAMTAAGIAPP